MLLFLASVLEQLDLALEHVSKGDIHNARFGLMLTDNAVELVLHQIAKDKVSDLKMFFRRDEAYEHQKALDKALGRNFDDKVRFARIDDKISDQLAQTITILHSYRNEVYHIGLKHETILPQLSNFYFDVACEFLSGYRSRGLGWGSNQRIPDRAQKYFHGSKFFPGGQDDFGNGCRTLRAMCQHAPAQTVDILSDELDRIIKYQDIYIGIVARGVYVGQETTRSDAVRSTQAWKLAFTEEGRNFAFANGFEGNLLNLVQFITDKYPLQFRSDPIPSWKKQAATMRANRNPHGALSKYHSFLSSTADIREAIEESAGAAEAEIEAASDRARGR